MQKIQLGVLFLAPTPLTKTVQIKHVVGFKSLYDKKLWRKRMKKSPEKKNTDQQ